MGNNIDNFVTFRKNVSEKGETPHYHYISTEADWLANIACKPEIWFASKKILVAVMIAMIPHVDSEKYVDDLVAQGFEIITYRDYQKEVADETIHKLSAIQPCVAAVTIEVWSSGITPTWKPTKDLFWTLIQNRTHKDSLMNTICAKPASTWISQCLRSASVTSGLRQKKNN